MSDHGPTCGWGRRDDKDRLVPCGQPAIAVHKVWAVDTDRFLQDTAPQPMALLTCRRHTPDG